MSKQTTGLVLGKFLPLHRGHEFLFHFAQQFVDKLFVVVDNIPDAKVPGLVRCAWVQKCLPQAEVFYLPHANPQDPSENPDFWHIWKNSLQSLLPSMPDYIFASEHYGEPLAQALNATFIPVDIKRQTYPISATLIRQNLGTNWQELSKPAKSFYLKRVCIFGPESTGKTTLAQELAQHFDTQFVPEYARWYIETHPQFSEKDMLHIAKGQIALEHSLSEQANQVLFCDTDPLSTTLWSQWLFDSCSEELQNCARIQKYHLYLLTYPDLDWVADKARYLEGKSMEFFNLCKQTLEEQGRAYLVIQGKNEQRLQAAIKAVERLLDVEI